MMVHILYYLIEALVLAVPYWLGVALAAKALVAYDAEVRFHGARTFLLLWFLLFVVGIILGKTCGLECLAPFHIGLWVLAAGVVFRLYSVIFHRPVRPRGF